MASVGVRCIADDVHDAIDVTCHRSRRRRSRGPRCRGFRSDVAMPHPHIWDLPVALTSALEPVAEGAGPWVID